LRFLWPSLHSTGDLRSQHRYARCLSLDGPLQFPLGCPRLRLPMLRRERSALDLRICFLPSAPVVSRTKSCWLPTASCHRARACTKKRSPASPLPELQSPPSLTPRPFG